MNESESGGEAEGRTRKFSESLRSGANKEIKWKCNECKSEHRISPFRVGSQQMSGADF